MPTAATVYGDVRHHRNVALKVRKPELAAVIGVSVEIETTANLQHSPILPLHDSGEVEGRVLQALPRCCSWVPTMLGRRTPASSIST